jgi:hypothetical protein
MRPNPAEEWQRLTKLYGEMSDGQLLELAEGLSDLTEIAQPILRDEMKKRGLEGPAAGTESKARLGSETAPMAGFGDKSPIFGRWNHAVAEQNGEFDASEAGTDESGVGQPVEYTWKTLLCECEEREEAWQVSEALRRAGIESWIDGPRSQQSWDVRLPRILVAADQLDEARAVIERPIPQDIIDQSKAKVEDFAPPTCPKCGAADPLLESVDPVNTWSCEVCGATWSDSTAFHEASSEPVS